MLILSFDIGLKYIGVAIGNNIIKSSRPLTTLIKDKNTFFCVFRIIDYWRPGIIIIGYPISNEFKNKNILKYINNFFFKLNDKLIIPIYLVNENLTTWQAKNVLFINRLKIKKPFLLINAMSASMLIDQWFLNRIDKREN